MFVLKSQQILRAVTLLPLFAFTSAQAQTDNSKNNNEGSSKEEGNRNVMLNASSANGPREIQIGRLPTLMCWKTVYPLPMPPIRIL